ncbi:hypothetical protein LCGC14_2081010 [marine sediment metagenome]|uniref:Uncharacterized protein n=1 Tax=marine sediment metagenome TaxID=412755 RepID=A0A0F9EFW1_9ZZZZ
MVANASSIASNVSPSTTTTAACLNATVGSWATAVAKRNQSGASSENATSRNAITVSVNARPNSAHAHTRLFSSATSRIVHGRRTRGRRRRRCSSCVADGTNPSRVINGIADKTPLLPTRQLYTGSDKLQFAFTAGSTDGSGPRERSLERCCNGMHHPRRAPFSSKLTVASR